jgi:hypothetical protein
MNYQYHVPPPNYSTNSGPFPHPASTTEVTPPPPTYNSAREQRWMQHLQAYHAEMDQLKLHLRDSPRLDAPVGARNTANPQQQQQQRQVHLHDAVKVPSSTHGDYWGNHTMVTSSHNPLSTRVPPAQQNSAGLFICPPTPDHMADQCNHGFFDDSTMGLEGDSIMEQRILGQLPYVGYSTMYPDYMAQDY